MTDVFHVLMDGAAGRRWKRWMAFGKTSRLPIESAPYGSSEMVSSTRLAAVAYTVPGRCERAGSARYVGLGGVESTFNSGGMMHRTLQHEACTVTALGVSRCFAYFSV